MLNILKQYYPIRNIMFFILEGLVIFGSVLLASVLLTYSNSYMFDLMLFFRIALVTFVCQISLYYNDLYDFEVACTISEISIRLLQSLGITAIVLALVYTLFPLAIIDQFTFFLSILFLLIFIIGWRVFYIFILGKGFFNEKIILLGSSSLSLDIFNEIDRSIACGYSVAAVIPDTENDCFKDSFNKQVFYKKNKDDLCETAREVGVKKIVVALEDRRGNFPSDELVKCRVAGIEVVEGNTFYEMFTGKILVAKLNPSWLIFSDGFKKSKIRTFLKRLEDIVISSSLLFFLFPCFLFICVLIKIDSKGPVFFSQDRVGQRNKEYMMYKFRSMVENAEKNSGPVWADENDDRITRVGKIIRKLRIDELPQLWNVLKGNMSLVGPRPERKYFTDDLEKKIPFYSQRFVVKPGITGWAQVSYDYGASLEDAVEKLNYDLFYIKNMSTLMDVVIILRTIKTVLFGKGAR